MNTLYWTEEEYYAQEKWVKEYAILNGHMIHKSDEKWTSSKEIGNKKNSNIQNVLNKLASSGMPATIIKQEEKINTKDITEKRYEYLKSVLDLKNYTDFVAATKWCDQYILNSLETQIKKAIDKNDKALKLIKKVNCAKKNVDINLVSIDICGNELKQIARSCAKLCFNLIEENQICFLKDLLLDFNKEENQKRLKITLPKIDFSSSLKPEQLLKRLITQKWWAKKLRTTIERNRFAIFSHVGAVGKSMSKYAPIDSIENFKKKLAAQEAFIKNNSVINKITGETKKLSEIASTNEKRFAQMYTLIKGLDTYAKELGLKAAMITLTAPEKYHCNPKHGKNSWHLSDYADQKETQEWIAENWNLVTMRLNKHKVEKYSLRIAEVHTDSTVHWHAIIYYKAEHETIIKNAIADVWNLTEKRYWVDIKKYNKSTLKRKKSYTTLNYQAVITAKMVTKKGAIKDEDKKRIGKIEHVLHKNSIAANWIDIDPKKGSGASYICKYISKSLLFDASKKSKFNDQDENEVIKRDKKFEDEYNSLLGVATTRSVFNIRSFQFSGLPKSAISLWLMYRRQRNANLDNKMERLRRDAACNNDFCRFIKLIKGNTPKIDYEEKINSFGEIIKKAVGYTVTNNSPISLFISNTKISDKTTFKFFKKIETFNVIKNDFMIVNNNDIFKLFNGDTFNTNTVRENHSVPSACGENQEKKRDIRLMNNFYDDDPIFWFTE